MERNQAQNVQPRNNNNNNRNNNNPWPRRNPSNDQKPPTPLESTNVVDHPTNLVKVFMRKVHVLLLENFLRN